MTDVKIIDDVSQVNGKPVNGVLVSDKVGEVKFISMERLLKEGIKEDYVQV